MVLMVSCRSPHPFRCVSINEAEPELPMDLSGKTFSHIFGTNTTPFELLVIKRKIMGPCWLEIKGAQTSTKSVSAEVRAQRTRPDC